MATYDGKKALIVDDFPTARRLIKETLQEIGFECVEAADVDQALKLFDEEKVDLVIADTFMPEKNGMDLLKTLRENPENEELIGIMSTSFKSHTNFTKDKIFTINCIKKEKKRCRKHTKKVDGGRAS